MDEALESRLDELLRARKSPQCLRIGIGGGSGSGKSTIVALICQHLLPLTTEVVTLDHFFKPTEPDRGKGEWSLAPVYQNYLFL